MTNETTGETYWAGAVKDENGNELTDKNGETIYAKDESLTKSMSSIKEAADTSQNRVDNLPNDKFVAATQKAGETVGTIEDRVEAIRTAEGTLSNVEGAFVDWNQLTLDSKTLMADAVAEYNKATDAIDNLTNKA
jgi:hypothetical protein